MLHRIGEYAALIGAVTTIELLAETRLGLSTWTTGSPLAYDGILIELPAAIWFIVKYALEREVNGAPIDRQPRLNFYNFAWSILGIAAIAFVFMNADPSARFNWQYWLAAGAISVTFLSTGLRRVAPVPQVIRGIGTDLAHLASGRRMLAATVLAALLAMVAPTSANVPSRRTPVLHGEELVSWFDAQPRQRLPESYPQGAVVLATFVDYLCPACLEAAKEMAPVIAGLKDELGSKLVVISLDFPLDSECNSGKSIADIHPLACEAAAVMRLTPAAEKDNLTQWLWQNQTGLTRAKFLEFRRSRRGPENHSPEFKNAFEDVRNEAALGYALGVRRTPSYWLNGVVSSRIPPADLAMLVRLEANRVDTTRR